jgi:RHS repeat-associated protein
VTATSQDSEPGLPVTTLTEYLTGFLTRHTDGRSHATTSTYQAFDAPTYDYPMEIAAPAGRTTTFTRDVFGKPLTMKRSGPYTGGTCPGGPPNSLCATRTFVYDGHQRLCKVIEPDAGITVTDYDLASNMLWRAKGQSTLTSTSDCQRGSATDTSMHYYDAMNRLLAIDHPVGTEDVGYTYAADGAMLTARTGTLINPIPAIWGTESSAWTYTYNARRLLESESLAIDGKTFALDWSYNTRGDSSGLVYPSGLGVTFNPNAYGEPREVAAYGIVPAVAPYAATPSLSPFGYHPNGLSAKFTYGNDAVRTVTLNARQMPLRILDQHSGISLLDHTLGYDENANVKDLTDGVSGGLETRSMEYDALNRLTEVAAGTGAEVYEYDPLDRLRRTVVLGQDRRFSYDATTHRLDQQTILGNPVVLDYDWNLRGELATRVRTGGKPQTITYTFDRASRLTRVMDVADTRHVYDAHGHRVRSHDETSRDQYKTYHVYSRAGQYLYRDESEPPGERTEFFHLGKTLVAERTGPSGGPHIAKFLHADHLGTTSVKTAFNGTVDYRSRKMPYGAPYDGIWRDGPDFTGHVADNMDKLIYMQQRYYDPQIGQFISPDPVSASAESFNVYWYANNKPYTMVDPDGRSARSMEDHPAIQQTVVTGNIDDSEVPRWEDAQRAKAPPRKRTAGDAFGDAVDYVADQVVNKVLPALGPAEAVVAGGGKAVGAGIVAVRLGQAGERAVRVAHDIGPIGFFRVGWRVRMPDGVNHYLRTVSEVKNVASQGLTRQLRDYMDYAASQGYSFHLFVRSSTHLSAPLLEARNAGRVVIQEIPPGAW